MQFNSYEFILIFLPVVFAGYFALNRLHAAAGKLFLAAACVYFYTYTGFASLPVLLASVVLNYGASVLIVRKKEYAKLFMALCVVLNVAILVYFKYFGFLVSNINSLLHTSFAIKDIILPLGVSFFTFQQIYYTVNVYRKGSNEKLLDYLVYILFFPKLIMGPISEPDAIIRQFNDEDRKRIQPDNVAAGLRVFSFGLFKKMVLADTFAAAVFWGFSNIPDAGSLDMFIVMLAYTFELYFDFSGYSDMAIGISLMLNIELPINFDSPFKSLSVKEYWRRWHMTLTDFLSKHVYFPLGGSRLGKTRTYFNVFIVFFISGIWHGANWTYILWGSIHGIICVIERMLEKVEKKIPAVLRWAYTFLTVSVLLLLFTSESVSQWVYMVKRILLLRNMTVSPGLMSSFVIPESGFILSALHLNALSSFSGLWMLVFFAAAFFICLVPENNYRTRYKRSPGSAVLAAVAFAWSFICMGGESVFVYFNF